MEMPGPFPFGKYPKEGRSREEILGEPLQKWEISMLVKPMLSHNRQVNLGGSGFLTSKWLVGFGFFFSLFIFLNNGVCLLVSMWCREGWIDT